MSKDFAEIAHDVIAGVGLLQRGAPDTMKAFGAPEHACMAFRVNGSQIRFARNN